MDYLWNVRLKRVCLPCKAVLAHLRPTRPNGLPWGVPRWIQTEGEANCPGYPGRSVPYVVGAGRCNSLDFTEQTGFIGAVCVRLQGHKSQHLPYSMDAQDGPDITAAALS